VNRVKGGNGSLPGKARRWRGGRDAGGSTSSWGTQQKGGSRIKGWTPEKRVTNGRKNELLNHRKLIKKGGESKKTMYQEKKEPGNGLYQNASRAGIRPSPSRKGNDEKGEKGTSPNPQFGGGKKSKMEKHTVFKCF